MKVKKEIKNKICEDKLKTNTNFKKGYEIGKKLVKEHEWLMKELAK